MLRDCMIENPPTRRAHVSRAIGPAIARRIARPTRTRRAP